MRYLRACFWAVASLLFTSMVCHAVELGPVDMHGFISQGYIKSSAHDFLAKTEKGTYEFNEAGINFSTALTEKFQLGLQLTARDLGDDGNNEVNLDWGVADYRFCNAFGLRLGKIKVPFGLYNEGRDLDMLRTNVLLPQGVYHESMRPFWNAMEGGGVYGTISTGPLGSVEYNAAIGTNSIDFESTHFKNSVAMLLIMPEDIENASLDVKYINMNRLLWNTPLEGLRLGVTQGYVKGKLELDHVVNFLYAPSVVVAVSNPYTQMLRMRMNVISGEYKWKNLTLAGEYFTWGMGVDYDLPATFGYPPFTLHQKQLGYYGSAAYRFFDWLEVGAYRNIYYANASDRDGEEQNALTGRPDFTAWQHDSCLTLRFDITPSWLIKLEGHHMDGTAMVYTYDSINDLKKTWSLYAAKTTFSF